MSCTRIRSVVRGIKDFRRDAPKEEVEEEKTENVIDIEAKPEITFDDFEKLQFQVGEIIACEEVKKSRKLLCSQVCRLRGFLKDKDQTAPSPQEFSRLH